MTSRTIILPSDAMPARFIAPAFAKLVEGELFRRGIRETVDCDSDANGGVYLECLERQYVVKAGETLCVDDAASALESKVEAMRRAA
jgi:hypothetical protein